MYALLYIFVCQLSSAVDFENGWKYEVRCGGCWWPCATVSAVRRTMVEIGEADGEGDSLVRSPEERHRGGSHWLPQCRQDSNDIYSCPQPRLWRRSYEGDGLATSMLGN
jgi:hypothetical protein